MSTATDLSGKTFFLADRTPVRLLYPTGEGGQASVYAILRRKEVAKIYSDPAQVSERKLDRLISIYDCAVRQDGKLSRLCLPKDKLFDSQGRCVGYTMDFFRGTTLGEALWQTVLTERGWTRKHLVDLAIAIVEAFSEVRYYGILIGDINLNNILVDEEGEFAIIDTDSVQIRDEFACPVGRYEFTSARLEEAQKRGEPLRTEADENYAITTLLFYILMPEKSPFMSSADLNVYQAFMRRRFVFPEGYGDVNAMAKGTERMWYDLPQPVRRAFCRVYNDGDDITPQQWLDLLRDYRTKLEGGRLSLVIFPRRRQFSLPLQLTAPTLKFDRLIATPDHDYSDKSINELAIAIIDSDGIWGIIHNCWENLKSLNQSLKVRRLSVDLFSRLDSDGRLPIEGEEWTAEYRRKMLEWVKWLRTFTPPFKLMMAVAAPAARAVTNRGELSGFLKESIGLNVNFSFAPDEDEAFASLAVEKAGQKCVALIDNGVTCRLLFVADGRVAEALTVGDSCGHRLLANRFFFTYGADRVPAEAWNEHNASCRTIVRALDLPSGFNGVPLVVMGLTGIGSAKSVDTFRAAMSEKHRQIILNRSRVADYQSELLDYNAARFFYCCLSFPIVAEIAARLDSSSVMEFPADMKSIVAYLVSRRIKGTLSTSSSK